MDNGRKAIGVIASLVAIVGGVWLFLGESAAAETTVFDMLMDGIGVYMFARGLWMIYEIARDDAVTG